VSLILFLKKRCKNKKMFWIRMLFAKECLEREKRWKGEKEKGRKGEKENGRNAGVGGELIQDFRFKILDWQGQPVVLRLSGSGGQTQSHAVARPWVTVCKERSLRIGRRNAQSPAGARLFVKAIYSLATAWLLIDTSRWDAREKREKR